LQSDGFRLWVDAGICLADDAGPLAGIGIERLVVGLETVAGPAALAAICQAHGKRIIFSLDLKGGQPLAVANAWQTSDPFEIAGQAVALGVTSILVLDLQRVGTATGTGTEDLCRRVSAAHPHVELTAGGGVRGLADLQRLQDSGVHAVLIASALHDGIIKPGDWR
jgi:phosphoribosylformimino-5-aminoimidazole carboxamide ribotide isomerase